MAAHQVIPATPHVFKEACVSGKLWLVKKCIDSGLQIDPTYLEAAVRFGRTSVVHHILEAGTNPNICQGIVSNACALGFHRIVADLLHHGADVHETDDQPLISAVENGHTQCVLLLLEHGANVHIRDDAPLITACQMNYVPILQNLIKYGANVDARNGEPLIHASDHSNMEVLHELLKNGADAAINDDEPLKRSARNNNAAVMIALLNNGANRSALNEYDIPETTWAIVKTFTKRYYINKLKKSVHDSFTKEDFKWQAYCKPMKHSDFDVSALRDQGRILSVDDVDKKSKRYICYELAVNMERDMRVVKDKYDDTSFTDLSGTMISELPFWKIMEIDNIPFNSFDLFRMLKQGITTNPYTRKPLPVEAIRQRETVLRQTLVRSRIQGYPDTTFLERVSTTPVASDESYLRSRLETEVWDKLLYAPSLDILLNASDVSVNNMLRNLRTLCRRKSLYEIFSQQWISDIYPMLNANTEIAIWNASGILKKRYFTDLLCAMVNKTDQHTETRRMCVSMMLRHQSNVNAGHNEDDLTFIFGEDDSDDGLYDDLMFFDDF